MRLALAALSTLAVATAYVGPMRSAQARDYPWCAQYSERSGGGRNCGFVSFEQCQATAMGAGAWCQPNPRYTGGDGDRRNRRRYKALYSRD